MCDGCGETASTAMTPWGLLCAHCESLADRDEKLKLEISDECAEEWRDEEMPCRQ